MHQDPSAAENHGKISSQSAGSPMWPCAPTEAFSGARSEIRLEINILLLPVEQTAVCARLGERGAVVHDSFSTLKYAHGPPPKLLTPAIVPIVPGIFYSDIC